MRWRLTPNSPQWAKTSVRYPCQVTFYRGVVRFTEARVRQDRNLQETISQLIFDQIESFRIGDKKSDREDDLLDTFCHGIVTSTR